MKNYTISKEVRQELMWELLIFAILIAIRANSIGMSAIPIEIDGIQIAMGSNTTH